MLIPNNILKKAIKASENSNVIRGQLGAVLFTDNGTILCHAHNSSFLGSKFIRTVHAEQALLNKADRINAMERYGRDLNVLVVRWRQGSKTLANAKPCLSCTKRLNEYPFRVFYSNEDGEIEEYEK